MATVGSLNRYMMTSENSTAVSSGIPGYRAVYYDNFGESWGNRTHNLLVKHDFSGAIVTYFHNGEAIGEESFDFEAENNEKIEEIRNDLKALCVEHAKKAVYRLTDVEVTRGRLIKTTTHSDGREEILDVTDDVLHELETGVKRVVYTTVDIVEALTEINPTAFEGWEVVIADEEYQPEMESMPKNLDGYKDETSEDYAARIKEKVKQIQREEQAAVRNVEKDQEIERLLYSL